jgi:hypothetical protein
LDEIVDIRKKIVEIQEDFSFKVHNADLKFNDKVDELTYATE